MVGWHVCSSHWECVKKKMLKLIILIQFEQNSATWIKSTNNQKKSKLWRYTRYESMPVHWISTHNLWTKKS